MVLTLVNFINQKKILMKNFLLTFSFLATTISMSAQPGGNPGGFGDGGNRPPGGIQQGGPGGPGGQAGMMNNDDQLTPQQKAKILKQQLINKLQLTKEEQNAFLPMWENYEKEKFALAIELKKNAGDVRDQHGFDSLNNEEFESVVFAELNYMKARIELLQKYYAQFQTAIPKNKLVIFLKGERITPGGPKQEMAANQPALNGETTPSDNGDPATQTSSSSTDEEDDADLNYIFGK